MRTLKNKNVLITGGAGFIGTNLSKMLLDYKCQITSLDIVKSKVLKVKVIQEDLKKFVTSSGIKKGNFDYIIHLAGSTSIKSSIENPGLDYKFNLEASFLLLEEIRQLKKKPLIIFASSAAVYGIPKKWPVSEESPTIPLSPYGASKLAVEKYLQVYFSLYNIPSVILRFFSVYGPGQKKQVIYDLTQKIQKNFRELEIYGSPDQLLNMIYIDDLIKGIILIVQKGENNGVVYNLAHQKSYPMSKIVEILCAIFQVKPKIKYLEEKRPGANLKWVVDISKIKEIGFQPEIEIENGLTKVKEWIKK